MRTIGFITGYYDNPDMYSEQMRSMIGLSQEMKQHLEIVVVDDCSPRLPLVPEDCGIKAMYFRTLVDVPWNIPFVRNLGVSKSTGDWIILTDIDHVFSYAVLFELLRGEYDPAKVYTFRRIRQGEIIRPHPNTYFMARSVYEAAGGDDERTAGVYALQEWEFRERIKSKHELVELPLVLTNYNWSGWRTTRVETLCRRRDDNWREIRDYWQEHNKPGYKPLRLSFPYKELATFDPSSAKAG
jgi:glycosyltransferase involved in cell wall biosynthesis